MRLTTLYVERPCTVLSIGFVLLILVSAVSAALGYFDLNPQHNREFLVWDHEATVAWDKQIAGKEALLKSLGGK